MKQYTLVFTCLLVCLTILACGVQKTTVEENETNTSTTAKKKRIILHKPEDLQGQVHQVDSPMNFIEVKRDTTKIK